MSAYCQFKYNNQFFSKYKVGDQQAIALADEVEEVLTVRGQLLTKVSDLMPDLSMMWTEFLPGLTVNSQASHC
jgi:hypothetical protein